MAQDVNPVILNRIRSEYIEMPGLALNSQQLQRLCGVDRDACEEVVKALIEAGFLARRDDGSYARTRDSETTHIRTAKATLESHLMAHAARLRRRAS